MAAALYAGARLHDLRRDGAGAVGVGCPGDRSGAAQRHPADLRRADADHGAGAVLLDVLDPAALGRAHASASTSPAISTPISGTSSTSSIRSRRPGWRAASTTCCPTCRPSTSRPQWCTACRFAAGYHGADDRLRPVLHRGAADRRDHHLLAAGFQVRREQRRPCSPASAWCCASQRHRPADRPRPCLRGRRSTIPSASSTSSPADADQAADARLRRACRPTSTGFARSSTTAAIASEPPPPRSKYQLLYPLLDHATTLDPYFTIAYRFGAIFLSDALSRWGRPAGPGDRAARERASRRSRTSGSTSTTSPSSTTGTPARSETPPPTGSGKPPPLPKAPELAQAAGGDDARRRQRSRRRPASCGCRCSSRRRSGCATTRRAACCSSTPCDIDRSAAAGRPAVSAGGRRAVLVGARSCGGACCAASRSIPAGTPFEIDPATGAVSLSRRPPAFHRCRRPSARDS